VEEQTFERCFNEIVQPLNYVKTTVCVCLIPLASKSCSQIPLNLTFLLYYELTDCLHCLQEGRIGEQLGLAQILLNVM
jgi:hypothetical protein